MNRTMRQSAQLAAMSLAMSCAASQGQTTGTQPPAPVTATINVNDTAPPVSKPENRSWKRAQRLSFETTGEWNPTRRTN